LSDDRDNRATIHDRYLCLPQQPTPQWRLNAPLRWHRFAPPEAEGDDWRQTSTHQPHRSCEKQRSASCRQHTRQVDATITDPTHGDTTR
jgi:hypothetical protein